VLYLINTLDSVCNFTASFVSDYSSPIKLDFLPPWLSGQ
jgi:hypothetical protein